MRLLIPVLQKHVEVMQNILKISQGTNSSIHTCSTTCRPSLPTTFSDPLSELQPNIVGTAIAFTCIIQLSCLADSNGDPLTPTINTQCPWLRACHITSGMLIQPKQLNWQYTVYTCVRTNVYKSMTFIYMSAGLPIFTHHC